MSVIPLLLLAGAVTALHLAGAGAGFPAKLILERAVPVRGAPLEHLRVRDGARHGRLLLGSSSLPAAGVVDFPVDGSANPAIAGLYFSRVKLGNPAKEFYVQIDTGSDILWVTCSSCAGCPTSSGLNIQLEFFDPDKSSTSTTITCSDDRCSYALQSGQALCSSSDFSSSLCGYSFQYGDGSGTSGCSNSQSGDLTKSDRAVDGIFGFGQNDLSVISQLSSAGNFPKVFSHCLKGSDNGGGILVLGEIVEPGIVYTPLVQSQPHYNLNLESLAVNGRELAIDSSLFATSNTQGTIVDSGTTLAYLAEKAYIPFVNAILASLPSSVHSFALRDNVCFVTSDSVDESFPSVTLKFMGGASMLIKPEDYLLQQGSIDNSIIWCIGWQNNKGSGITILGDLVLKDKIFVYDLANQRIGWMNYDCSQSVNVSTASGKNEYLTAGQLDVSGSSDSVFSKLLSSNNLLILIYIFIIASL
ncbi:aspartic proteinase 36-like isoform X2 [Musa acuminata AAA Group]|uniref:aspartic proteinase 36-like isoform X2 n=1 Tax=Musa acuminata AAA Group TaxID=214697 RepID=UPI0031D4BEA3